MQPNEQTEIRKLRQALTQQMKPVCFFTPGICFFQPTVRKCTRALKGVCMVQLTPDASP